MKSLPKIIDMDLINELKRAGRYKEVKELLKAFHKDVKKTVRLANNDFNTKIRKIKKHKGICTTLGCYKNTEDGRTFCNICTDKKHKKYKQSYKERKAKNLCIICCKKIKVGKVKCEDCLKKYREMEKSRKLKRKWNV